MRTANRYLVLFLAGSVTMIAACKEEEARPRRKPAAPAAAATTAKPTGLLIDSAKLTMFASLPAMAEAKENPVTDEKVTLGRMLFYDARLSKSQTLSCNNCHDLGKHGVDGKPVSDGHRGQKGTRNSPTVYNAALQFAQFWDGRAETVEAQAKGPVLNPVEMAMPNEKRVVDTLKSIPEYVAAFKAAFPDDEDAVTYDNFAKAVGAFERKLLTPSRWDKLVAGDQGALTDDEKKGFLKFVEVGCPECHTGALAGGTMYQKLGKVQPWPKQTDKGRMAVTKSSSDEMMFKVPSLREVEHTGPYFHDGSVATLEEAVKLMAHHQLGKELTDEDVKSIVAWLKSLSGEVPASYIEKPTLPPSTKETPKADPT